MDITTKEGKGMKALAIVLIVCGLALAGAEAEPGYWWLNMTGVPVLGLGAGLARIAERKVRRL